MMNKLVYAHRIILKPYVDALKNTSSDDSLRRIQEIQTLLAHNTEKRETLTKLMTQGIIDPILFNKETNELLRRRTVSEMRSSFKKCKFPEMSQRLTKPQHSCALREKVEYSKNSMMTCFKNM